MPHLPARVNVCECWVRDGLQGYDRFIPTEKKIAMIDRMADIGFKRIEATSFAHPRLIPQFADCEEVLKGITRPPDVTYIAVVPNDKGLDRLLEFCDRGYGVQEITAILSASEDHLLANIERTFAEAMPPLAALVKRARQAGLTVIGCIATSFGCPLAGEVPVANVVELTDWYLSQGATSIMLGDTTGEANPRQVREVFGRMRDAFPEVDFIAHFHDTRGMGLANTVAALQEGIVLHDSSLGGMGGQPATRRPKYHKGFAGNTCTEDMVLMMEEMGVDTGLDIDEVIAAGLLAEEACGQPLLGHVTRSGAVRHRCSRPLCLADLRQGGEIPPALLLTGRMKEQLPAEAIAGHVIREALAKQWPVPENVTISVAGVSRKEELGERDILVTRFRVAAIEKSTQEAVLEVLSQKANGDVFLEGQVRLIFPERNEE
jgi:hydroxymethylglutaryl-CoA lyase